MIKLKKDYEDRELSRLKQMMKDPRYWKINDPDYHRQVSQGFADLYENPPARALAREGEAANELGVNGPRHGQDEDLAHLTPGEIVVPLSAQSVDVLNALYAAMGDRMAHYVVGAGYEQRNPTSGLPAFADKKGWFNKATRWHFEERDDRNRPLPKTEKQAHMGGFVSYPQSQSKFHQNDNGEPERKYAHPDGREVVFDGDTGKVENSPKLRGTFNYVHQEPFPKNKTDIVGWAKSLASMPGHGLADYVPWLFGETVRGDE